MITIKKVLAAQEGGCNACYTLALRKHTKYVFNIQIKNNPNQSTSIRLCKLHLNELACACADALDPMPTPKKKPKKSKAVGWQKVMDDLVNKKTSKSSENRCHYHGEFHGSTCHMCEQRMKI